MLNHSNKSKGFLPVKSGPNMAGFDMGKPQSLMEMMQTGGPTTRGGAALARALQFQEDQKRLREAEKKEAERQKRGGLFGSIGGLAGGLLGAALAPVTGGASLAIASGLGTALGRRVGEGIGAGKSRSVDRTGTVFGQQSFRDVEKASRDFTRGMGERALASGLKAAATAGLTPGGGIYGKTAQAAEAGKLGAFGTRLREGASAIGKTGARLGLGSGRALTTASGQLLSSGVPANIAGSALADTVLGGLDSPGGGRFGISQAPSIGESELLGDVAVPEFDTSLPDFSGLPQAPSVSEMAYQRSLPDAISLGEENALLDAARTAQQAEATAREASRSAGSLIGYLRRQDLGPLADFSIRRDSGSFTNPLLTDAVSPYFNLPMSPRRSPSVEVGPLTVFDGSDNLLGMQTGGFTAQSVLQSQGLAPTDEQLALFQQFDPTGLQGTAESLRMGQISGARQARQQQAGTGFAGAGAVEQAQSAISRAAQRAFGTAVGQEQQRFSSDVLGTAADLVAGGAEFGTYTAPQEPTNAFGPAGAPTSPPSGSQTIPGQPDSTIGQLQTGTDGQTYEWNGSSWILIPTDPNLGGDIGEGTAPRVTGP
jgi:hypothetical protein